MNKGNVISFDRRRDRIADGIATRAAARNSQRSQETEDLLQKLRETKRLLKEDQSRLVANLGRLVCQLDPEAPKTIVQSVLEPSEREKRTRYIRLPNESVGRAARYAGNGASFASIIERLIKLKILKGVERPQAMSEVARKVLQGTSFLPPSPFYLRVNNDVADVAQLAADMKAMCDQLAHEADLADFFALVSKHPIFPDDAWYQWSNSLELKADHEPNHTYEWDSDEDEIENWIPWWAPRCLIGHWYLPFHCKVVRLPEDSVAKVIAEAGGKPERYSSIRYQSLIEPFLETEHISSARIYHRLPMWLIVLPRPNRVVPCLYGAVHHPGGFYPGEQFPSNDDPVNPCFVRRIGGNVRDDDIFLPDDDSDDLNTFYVHVSETEINAIGSTVDDSFANFISEMLFASTPGELPDWLRQQPVQRLLKLTSDSDMAMSFALAPRAFIGEEWDRGDGTLFRSAFSNNVQQYTGLPPDSIAAYLQRSLVSGDEFTLFDALKVDACTKYAAAQATLSRGISSFRRAFEQRFEVDRSE